MMKKGLILCLSFLALSLSAQNNIQWRGTDRTGIYHETGLLKTWPEAGPALMWSYNGLGEGHSSVAVDSDKLYVTGLTDGKGYIYVFDTKGKLLNKKEYGPEWAESYNGSRGTVTINEGKIYLITGMAEIYCIDQQNLNVLWKKNFMKDFNGANIQWGVCETPLIIGEKVIATPGGKENNVVALNKNTGATIWSCAGEGDSSAYCSPLYIAGQKIPQIVTMTANHIIGINAATGEKLWSYPNKNRHDVHANTPVYSDGMILCTSGYGKGSTMLRLINDGRGVEQVWFNGELDNRIGAMVKVGDYAYGSGDANRFWFCVDWKTGEIKWKQRGLAMGNTIANEGMLYCYTDRGEMVLAKATPEKFDIVSKFPITLGTEQHWAHPIIYKGVLYVRHGDTLMAYQIK
ncbi:PQQ-binding-like beta-propeller repeat protein [Bacteroides sp. UBA939]|uniref:outer membrane protein assembly factor BamB family protein n=1 Tax=Bacteroides sp. UBA939 TaxID=1946092 RepID=UPI0025C2EE56|nr:PQQ-binding-like beta-propeller repeat protein [Bacteroides sp. UBA939]